MKEKDEPQMTEEERDEDEGFDMEKFEMLANLALGCYEDCFGPLFDDDDDSEFDYEEDVDDED